MLLGLDIRDMLIIDHLSLEFSSGLNVLTGETGAGKSILLDSLGFVLGWRGRADLVRSGQDQGEVSAWFDLGPSHPARAVLQEAGIPIEDELILRRVNTRDGRKTAWINDRRVSGEVLRAVSEHLVELHGQHDDRGLLDPKGHRDLLDTFGGHDDMLTTVSAAYRALRAAEKDLRTAESAQEELRAEEEFLRHAVDEFQELAPEVGEEAELDSCRRLMQVAEKIRADIAHAAQALGREGAEGMMSDAMRWLDGAADAAEGRLEEPLAALSRAMVELDDAAQGVEACLDALEFNPHDLELAEERLFAIRALARKHTVAPDELPTLAQDLTAKLDLLDMGAGGLKELNAAVAAAQAAYDEAAGVLSRARKSAAQALDLAMGAELAPLKMERAVFTTQVKDADPSATGVDQLDFVVATNPGAPAGPLAKIASGGELSRFLLALKVCLSRDGAQNTMIFDEIDRGVGGATADAVGRRLSRLAQDAQVLVVTHSPQVAALGDRHFQVAKQQSADMTLSRVELLSDTARVNEIARMISGDTITTEARAAARTLIEGR
ncbi:MAG: DNA repair protein RecN [Rhodobacteraceae bacterium]|nr:DNA repair protein RecN [Paracoccaceae bacterium]NCV66582.1 DNA repair protein RecN [Paracoccaceae bacterium]NCW61628.1 DNA repair protein RecN [Paracoccaceae bacterium]NCW65633.1 DNA repair protein RecN [Paracoccaceae bacterium]NCX08029.1 DNA repair protein RecN [Paracoccaceae bacterium]